MHPFEQHLSEPTGRSPVPAGAHVGSAGGAPCGDLVRVALVIEGGCVVRATFDAEGCGAAVAAGSAVVSLVEGGTVLDAARVGAGDVSGALGGLSPGKFHAADLAADALHRALAGACATGGELLAAGGPERVLVGVSGGVDSAVAALLCARTGAEVIAVTLKLWADREGDGERSCCSPQAVVTARALAHSMGLPHLTLDVEDGFRAAVVEPFVAEHDAGRTPNPCVRCNGHVRFDAMLQLADRLNAGALATGHYARIEHDAEGPLLARAADPRKDQTYMLSALRPEALARVRFPLGGLTKPEVRAIARKAGLPVAEKRDSQDLCFLAGTTRERFLARHGGAHERPGEVVDTAGHVLGSHAGHRRYTVGQRRGLGVAAGEPLFVLSTDPRENRVVVGPRESLATRAVVLRDVRLERDGGRVDGVKLRYRSEPLPCSVTAEPGRHEKLTATLGESALGVAPGQTACLLSGDLVVGHGTIAASA